MENRFKFRAWDVDNNCFYEPTHNASECSLHSLMMDLRGELIAHTMKGLSHGSTFPDKYIVIQYIGCKDKNGIEIYGSYIVEWNDGSEDEPWIRRAVVKLDPDIQYILTPSTPTGRPGEIFRHGSFIYSDTEKHLTIVGNEFEHPELLEKQ